MTEQPEQPPPPKPATERWPLIRDLVVFQVKLLVDGLKDLVLGPLSLVAAILDLARGTPRADGLFQGVLQAGAAFERWIGLYDALGPIAAHQALPPSPGMAGDPNLDDYIRRLEHVIVAQHQHGGITAEAKQAVDRAIDVIESSFKPKSDI